MPETAGSERITVHKQKETQSESFREEINALKTNQSLPKFSSTVHAYHDWGDSAIEHQAVTLQWPPRRSPVSDYSAQEGPRHKTNCQVPNHEREGHQMDVNYTINQIWERYLVVHDCQEVKRANKYCCECARCFRMQPAQQQMGWLRGCRERDKRVGQSTGPWSARAHDV